MGDYQSRELEKAKEEHRASYKLIITLVIAGFLAIVLWWMYGIYDRYLDCYCPNQCPCEKR
jgi:hypothetical protein